MRFDPRPLICVVGTLVAMLGGIMLLSAFANHLGGHDESLAVFLSTAAGAIIIGGGMCLATRGTIKSLNTRQAFVITTVGWIAVAGVGALPLYLEGAVPTYTDAYFEAMSALTTTGSTVMSDLEGKTDGVLLWRGLLQWIGGLGIVVMAIAIMPLLQIGGMQLFQTESAGPEEKILPSAAQTSIYIAIIFTGITLVGALAFGLAGMNPLDSIVHAMASVSTGGFSNYDSSLRQFEDVPAVDYIASFFMVLGGLPFILYVQVALGHWKALVTDSQVKGFLIVLVICVSFAVYVEYSIGEYQHGHTVRTAMVNVISVITGTGFATANYDSWGSLAVTFFFLIMFIGGCSGSATGGIKIFRFQVMYEIIRIHLKRIVYPNGVFIARYHGKPLEDNVIYSIMSFFFLYIVTFALGTIALSLCGLDPLTAMSGSITALANVGPGLGDVIGPSTTHENLGLIPKWILSVVMLLGRLELFTIFIMLSPRFWRF